jgi:hypothetical protein
VSAAKQNPHRPGIAPALGLRAGSDDLGIVSQTGCRTELIPFYKERLTMWLSQLCQCWLARTAGARRTPTPRRHGLRLSLEPLEDRTVPSSFTAANVSDLIADINAANAAGGSNTITLVAGTTFNLTEVNNTTDGATGLPVIAAKDSLSIVGNGDTIQRSTASGSPTFRLFDVASGASLSLANMTLQGGVEVTYNVSSPNGTFGPLAAGGAIFNQGSLSLNGVTLQNNSALGNNGPTYSEALGGGIYSMSGSLTLTACTIQGNQAVGGDAAAPVGSGGAAKGGGVYVFGGSASIANVILQNNSAQGGKGGPSEKICGYGRCERRAGAGGQAFGGGMCADGLFSSPATVSLHNCIVTSNSATGGPSGGRGGSEGVGYGGGLLLAPNILACLDAFTVAHTMNNKATTSGPDIYGSYTICP